MFQEKTIRGLSGWLMLVLMLALMVFFLVAFVTAIREEMVVTALIAIALFGVDLVALGGLTVVSPNEAKVVVLFGTYKGTMKQAGFWWYNPLAKRRRISLRIRNFESAKLKVNDQDGNPIEIAAVVVWKVVDSAEAVFQVDDYEHFVHVQSESAVRNLATRYPYDSHLEGEMSLRMSVLDIAHQ